MTHRGSDYTIRATFFLTYCLLINITFGLRFTIEPQDQTVVLATPAWLNCVATDVNSVSYRWSINDNILPAHENYIVLNNGTLHIRKVSADDVGTYTCTAETSTGQILQSREATLQLAYIDPSFSVQPRAQTVLLGDNVILTCKIRSLPPAEITWLLNGEVVILGTATQGNDGESTLVISPIMYYGAGEYKCKGTNPLLNVYRYSLGAELVVRGTPVFLASLEPVTVPQGFKATFNCYFHGNPEPSLTWFIHTTADGGQVSTREIFNSEKFHVNPNGTLTIYNVTDTDEAFYTCSVTNIFGQMSESAILNVTGVATLPEFTLQPQNTSVHEGGNVTLKWEASGNPIPKVVLFRNGGIFKASGGISQLTLVNIQPAQAGWYTCRAENKVGTVNSTVYVDVQVAPTFTLPPEDTATVFGDQFLLNCKADGNPPPKITWTTPQYGTVDSTTSFSDLNVYPNGTLVMLAAIYTDAGEYRCTAFNDVGYKQRSATVTVESPPEFSQLPTSQSVNQGETVYFHCQSTGLPTPTVTWSKDGEGTIVSSYKTQIYLNHTLAVRSVDQSDAGVYRCTASNRHDSIMAVATLTVTVPPSFTIRPENQTVSLGSRVELQCDSVGDPVTTQSWRKDGRYLYSADNLNIAADGSQISIDAITENQFGEYTCVASNLAGTRSVSSWIKQYDVPVIVLYPQNRTVNQSESLTLQCKGEVKTGTPSVVWYREQSGEMIKIDPNDRVTVHDDGDLEIQNVEPGDEGWYRCVLSNSAGAVSAQSFVNVYELPRIIHTNSPQTTVHQSSVTLTCQSTGDPPATLQWLRPSGTKVTTSSAYLIGNDSLKIVSANQKTDEGDWTCQSCNIVGCVRQSITVHIDGLPLIESFSAYKSGSAIKFECDVKGQPQPQITFTSQGQTVNGNLQGHTIQNNLLIVQQSSVRTEYTCSAANKYGRESVTLAVPGPLVVPSVVSVGSRWVTLQFGGQPKVMDDLPLTQYQVQVTSNGGRTWQNVPVTDAGISKPTNISSLMPYKKYNFRVAARNILGIGKYSEMSAEVQTEADAPSIPTNVVALEIDEGTILFTWSPPQFMNGDRVDVAYNYTVTVDSSDSIYGSDTVYYNGTLQAEVKDIMSSGLYKFSVKAVNLKIGKSSAPVDYTIDLSAPPPLPQTHTDGPSKIVIILAGALGGIIFICLVIFIAFRIRRRTKTESFSFLKPRLSVDQFYNENSNSESRLTMKRSRSGNSFYSFTHDDSFHGNGSSVKDSSGFSLNKRRSDGDVLLLAKNPLYSDTAMSTSSPSSRFISPEPLLLENQEQSYSLHEIEMPMTEVAVTTGSSPNNLHCGSHKTGSRPNSLNCGKTGSQSLVESENGKRKPLTPLSAENLEDDINDIYNSLKGLDKSSSKQSLEHVYASIHSDGQSSRSKAFSLSSDNSSCTDPYQPKPPTRVLSPDKLRISSSKGDTVDMATKRSSRSASPERSRSSSPMIISRPRPPTRVLGVDKMRTSPEAEIKHVHENSAQQSDDIKDITPDIKKHTDEFTNGIDDIFGLADNSTHQTDDTTQQYKDINNITNDIANDEIDKCNDINGITDGIDNDANNKGNGNAESNDPVIPLNEQLQDNTIHLKNEICEDDNDDYSDALSDSIHSNGSVNKEQNLEAEDNVDMIVPEADGSGEFLLAVKKTKTDPWRSKMEDNFLTEDQIKEELISAKLY